MSCINCDTYRYDLSEYLHQETIACEIAMTAALDAEDIETYGYNRGRRDEIRRVRKCVFGFEEYSPLPNPRYPE